MKVKSEVVGWVVTGVYLICVAVLVYYKRGTLSSLELNAIGDFLAGVFGPIAFLWLVLGYLQQGRELKLSSEALQLQAQELKNSVEQQTSMAQSAIAQIDSSRKALQLQIDEAERSISARFEFAGVMKGGIGPSATIKNTIELTNLGNLARDVRVTFDPPFPNWENQNYDLMGREKTRRMDFYVPVERESESFICMVSYEGIDGRARAESFECWIDDQNWLRFRKKTLQPLES